MRIPGWLRSHANQARVTDADMGTSGAKPQQAAEPSDPMAVVTALFGCNKAAWPVPELERVAGNNAALRTALTFFPRRTQPGAWVPLRCRRYVKPGGRLSSSRALQG